MTKQYEFIRDPQTKAITGVVNKGIGWCSHTANPLKYRLKEDLFDNGEIVRAAGSPVWFCVKVSQGCKFCYAERLALRWGQLPFTVENLEKVEPYIDDKEVKKILNLKVKGPYPAPHTRPAIFIEDMSDLWGEWVPFEMIDRVIAIAALRPDITFQFLTKRTARMLEYFSAPDRSFSIEQQGWSNSINRPIQLVGWPLPNVLMGFSAEDQPTFDARSVHMKQIAARGWNVYCSYEPGIGPLDVVGHGTIRGNNYCERGKIGGLGANGEPWYVTDGGTEWSAFDVRFAPDNMPWLAWLIPGGESGGKARPYNLDWMRSAIAQARYLELPIWCKQLGANPVIGEDETLEGFPPHVKRDIARASGGKITHEPTPGAINLRDSHGGDWEEWPPNMRVRQLPSMLNAADAFHAHLDECKQCADHPHALCTKGDQLIHKAVGATPTGGID